MRTRPWSSAVALAPSAPGCSPPSSAASRRRRPAERRCHRVEHVPRTSDSVIETQGKLCDGSTAGSRTDVIGEEEMTVQPHNASEDLPACDSGRRSDQCSFSDSGWDTELTVPSNAVASRSQLTPHLRFTTISSQTSGRSEPIPTSSGSSDVKSSKVRRPDHPDSAPLTAARRLSNSSTAARISRAIRSR